MDKREGKENFEIMHKIFVLIAMEKEWPAFRLQAHCVHSDFCLQTGGAWAVLGRYKPCCRQFSDSSGKGDVND